MPPKGRRGTRCFVMKIWKKCAILCLLALLCLTVGAAAYEDGEHPLSVFELPEIEVCEEACVEGEAALLAEPDYEGAVEALLAGIWRGDESIDISAYQIPLTYEDLVRLGNGIKYSPEAFGVQGIGRAVGSSIFTRVYPMYTISADEYEAAKTAYQAGLDEIVEQVDPDWSDLEKVLFVHDYLASHFEYDLTYKIYDSYQFLKYGTGVCEAYTKTFIAVAREVGLNSSYVESPFLNHAWNLVELDGNWYHLDVTHDDPITDRLGFARHLYFLLSDEACIALRRSVWTPGEGQTEADWTVDWARGVEDAAADTTYDTYFWQDAVSPFLQVDGIWYAVTKKGLKTWDGVSDAFGSTADSFSVYAAGLDVYCGRLYYNSYYGIRCYEPFTGRIFGVLDFGATHGSNYYGQGLLVEGDTLTYDLYWYDTSGTFRTGWAECDLEPYIAAPGGGFGYYVEDGTLYLNADDLSVAAICYDDDGRMTSCSLLTGEDTCPLQQGRVKLVALTNDGSWLPVGEILAGTVRTA